MSDNSSCVPKGALSSTFGCFASKEGGRAAGHGYCVVRSEDRSKRQRQRDRSKYLSKQKMGTEVDVARALFGRTTKGTTVGSSPPAFLLTPPVSRATP